MSIESPHAAGVARTLNLFLCLGCLVAGVLLQSRASHAEQPSANTQNAPLVDLTAESKAQFNELNRQISEYAVRRANTDETGIDTMEVWNGYRPSWRRLSSQTFNSDSLIPVEDRDPVDTVLRRTTALLVDLRKNHRLDLAAEQTQLDNMRQRAAATDPKDPARYSLYEELCRLRRTIAFANPLLNFDRILFLKRHAGPAHLVQQFDNARAIGDGGGIFVLENPFRGESRIRNMMADSVCRGGKLNEKKLVDGHFLSPELSYDGTKVLFAWNAERSLGNNYAIFQANMDGSNLSQLTDGSANDFDPCFLPNGRIAFVSTRRGGVGRCFDPLTRTYTLHRMNADGGSIQCLSFHETNEWHPCVNHDGMIVYTRWDYVDRGFNQAHHPWITTPDGKDPRALHGNYGQSPRVRPHAELDLHPIPDSRKFVATATGHHFEASGSLIVLDFDIPDDGAMAQVKRLTPEIPLPEAENHEFGPPQAYATAWPLGENYYLCAYADRRGTATQGIYLLDAFGNKELLYRDPEIECRNPIPVQSRQVPPVWPERTADTNSAEAGGTQASPLATVGVMNVYDSAKEWPHDTRIIALRIIEVLPKPTSAFRRNVPKIGYPSENGARAVLGTVPVEEDGSAYFTLPANKPVYFQALDSRGMAVQSMRSDTYTHPGEALMCQGCHESRHHVASAKRVPLALKRKPSTIQPETEGSNPFNYPRLVQPVLNRNCVGCHAKNPKAPDLSDTPSTDTRTGWSMSYQNLDRFAFYYDSGGGWSWNRWVVAETFPGKFGARASRLFGLLEKGHHDVKLSPEDLHRITLWLDSNSDFYGGYDRPQAQARGEIVKP